MRSKYSIFWDAELAGISVGEPLKDQYLGAPFGPGFPLQCFHSELIIQKSGPPFLTALRPTTALRQKTIAAAKLEQGHRRMSKEG
ncbi:MAG: hypothetical protein B6D68_01370 [spirochete symbiont of Stewartia floridana]|nr:MAG: hypothetical protein B6D68_01370 [spirochete symbiont of Stewartia floridana]